MDVKVGDVVHVRANVLEIGKFGCPIVEIKDAASDCHGRTHISSETIVHIEPRPLQIGDRVKRPVFRNTGGEIRAIDGTIAWIKHDDGCYANATLAELERA
jgi:hypothetical protein